MIAGQLWQLMLVLVCSCLGLLGCYPACSSCASCLEARCLQQGILPQLAAACHRCFTLQSHPANPLLLALQGFIDGIGPMASLPRFLATLGVKVLRSVPLRQAANQASPGWGHPIGQPVQDQLLGAGWQRLNTCTGLLLGASWQRLSSCTGSLAACQAVRSTCRLARHPTSALPADTPHPQMAYFNKQKYATDDAMRIGRLCLSVICTLACSTAYGLCRCP